MQICGSILDSIAKMASFSHYFHGVSLHHHSVFVFYNCHCMYIESRSYYFKPIKLCRNPKEQNICNECLHLLHAFFENCMYMCTESQSLFQAYQGFRITGSQYTQ